MICPHCNRETRVDRNFCVHCRHLIRDIRSVRIHGFTGPASLRPTVEEFWHTGDPSVFQKPGTVVGPLTGNIYA